MSDSKNSFSIWICFWTPFFVAVRNTFLLHIFCFSCPFADDYLVNGAKKAKISPIESPESLRTTTRQFTVRYRSHSFPSSLRYNTFFKIKLELFEKVLLSWRFLPKRLNVAFIDAVFFWEEKKPLPKIDFFICWLIDWLMDGSIDWLIDLLFESILKDCSDSSLDFFDSDCLDIVENNFISKTNWKSIFFWNFFSDSETDFFERRRWKDIRFFLKIVFHQDFIIHARVFFSTGGAITNAAASCPRRALRNSRLRQSAKDHAATAVSPQCGGPVVASPRHHLHSALQNRLPSLSTGSTRGHVSTALSERPLRPVGPDRDGLFRHQTPRTSGRALLDRPWIGGLHAGHCAAAQPFGAQFTVEFWAKSWGVAVGIAPRAPGRRGDPSSRGAVARVEVPRNALDPVRLWEIADVGWVAAGTLCRRASLLDFHADDAGLGYLGDFSHVPRVCVSAVGRVDGDWAAAAVDGSIQPRSAVLCLYPVDAVRRGGGEFDGRGHGGVLRQWLESHDGRAGPGPLSSHWADAGRQHLPVRICFQKVLLFALNRLIDWLIDWLIDRLIDWLIDFIASSLCTMLISFN